MFYFKWILRKFQASNPTEEDALSAYIHISSVYSKLYSLYGDPFLHQIYAIHNLHANYLSIFTMPRKSNSHFKIKRSSFHREFKIKALEKSSSSASTPANYADFFEHNFKPAKKLRKNSIRISLNSLAGTRSELVNNDTIMEQDASGYYDKSKIYLTKFSKTKLCDSLDESDSGPRGLSLFHFYSLVL